MIVQKKEFFMGSALMAVFIIVLAVMFMPLFGGHNALEFLDALYNSISKGSAYYIPKVKKEAEAFKGNTIAVELKLENETRAEQTAGLFEKSGAQVKGE